MGVAAIWLGWLALAAGRARRQNYPLLPHLVGTAVLGPIGWLTTWWLTRQPLRQPQEWEALNLSAHTGVLEGPLAETARRNGRETGFQAGFLRWLELERDVEMDRSLTATNCQLVAPAVMLLGATFGILGVLSERRDGACYLVGATALVLVCVLLRAGQVPRQASGRMREINLLALHLSAGESLPTALAQVMQGGNVGFTRSGRSLPEPLALPGLLRSASHQLTERRYYHVKFARLLGGTLVALAAVTVLWIAIALAHYFGHGLRGNLG